jgi:thiosulfate sulfurtransferase
MSFECISIEEANQMIAEGNVTLADVRDESSFRQSHIANAHTLNNSTLELFIEDADKTLPLIVYCYHGHSSQGAAQYLAQQGFNSVYSMDGGFEQWRQEHPTVTG